MPENHKSTHIRTSVRGRGKRLTKEQTQELQEKFLKSFSMTANIRAACMSAGIDRSTVYSWQEHDSSFSLRFNIAEQEANDVIRAEIFRRAVQGYEKPVVSMGRVVYEETPILDKSGKPVLNDKGKPVVTYGKPVTERVYSDALLSLLARARMPEFRDKQSVDLNATVNGRIDSTNLISIDTRSLTSDQLAKLKALAMEMKGGQQ